MIWPGRFVARLLIISGERKLLYDAWLVIVPFSITLDELPITRQHVCRYISWRRYSGDQSELFMINPDLDNDKQSTPYLSSCMAADISSLSMVESDVSGGDLLSAFDSICVSEPLEQRDEVAPDIKADTFDSIGNAYLVRQCSGDGKYIAKFDSSELADLTEPSAQGDGETKDLVGINITCVQSHSPIVYTSCLRRSARNTKSNMKNESPKPSNCGIVADKISEFDLSSLKLLRRSRSSYAKRIRSSVWGGLVNILPDMDKTSGIAQNLGNDRKRRSSKGGQGKRKSTKDQAGKKSTGKSSVPTRHISLKIKIGNKICSVGNTIESLSASGKFGESVSRDVVSSSKRNLEKVIPSDGSALSTHLQERDPFCNQSFDTSSKFHDIRSVEEGDSLRGLSEIRCSDVGTSPDSEVINSIPDVLISEKGLPLFQDGPIVSKALVSPTDISNLVLSPKHKKGKKKVRLPQEDNCMLGSKLTGAGKKSISSLGSPQAKSKKGRKKDKLCDVGNYAETNLKGIATTNMPNGSADRVGDIYSCSDSYTRTEKPYLNGTDTNPCSGLVAISKISNSPVCGKLNPCSNDGKTPKCSIAKGRRSRNFPNEKGTSTTKKGNRTPSDIGETGALSNAVTGSIDIMQFSSDGLREQYDLPRSAWVLCDKCQKWRRIPAALADQIEETDYGWTCQDNTDKDFADCSFPREKSNSAINEELEISDGSFAEDDCGMAGAFMNLNEDRSKAAQQSSWMLIKSNLFLQRSRKTQTIDEVMVCNCKPPSDGRMGCGAKCLNRVLNIECVQGTCPCGELCSNQQFQKRKYAKLRWFRCGKKGYGLQALEGIPQGQFLIEYIGEVLDVHAYEARQREYAMKSHRHFYFMTLNGSEVIDACFKGNLGRFINHSCDPNCRTEKWMVNGEVCIGLFSLRDIKKGEEVTFDYNFVRVFGAAAKKCVCGSANCRGYIGGDLTNTEVIAQDDSDDEFAEPVMTCDDGEMDEDWNDIMLNNSNDHEDGLPIEPSLDIYSMKNRLGTVGTVGDSILTSHISEASPKKVEGVNSELVAEFRVGDEFGVSIDSNSSANDTVKLNNNKTTGESLRGSMRAGLQVECNGIQSQMHESSQLMDITLQSDDVNKVTSCAHESAITASHSKSLSDNVDPKGNLEYATVEGMDELAKSKSLPKTNRLLLSIKKGKPKLNALKDKVSSDVDKLSAERCRSKKLPKLSLNHHFEAVEEKLNELLDHEGGISKLKDASRGYLKLLFLTAATGNNVHGEAIQSNRDLSMILDALLKTKSRTVLVDIINRNGLQMLHNILKRYRKEFIKTPILRKLLKVLEYLATREILTLEHITGGPPRPGFESFKDSVLTLAEHDDKQVHQIARNFRDKWIPRSLRKNFCIEMDDALLQYHHPSSHGGTSVSYDYWNGRGRKPSEITNLVETQSVTASGTEETSTIEISPSADEPKTRKRKSRWDNPVEYPHSRNRTNLVGVDEHNVDEDVPPGFSVPFKGPMTPSDASSSATNHQERDMRMKLHSNVVSGEPQLRFIAHMPVSYGIPSSIMQQFGVPQAEIPEGWSIAPGMSFHPFPPVPSCAHHEADRSISARCASSSAAHIEKSGPSSDTCLTYQTDQQNKKTCSMDLSGNNVLVTNGRLMQALVAWEGNTLGSKSGTLRSSHHGSECETAGGLLGKTPETARTV